MRPVLVLSVLLLMPFVPVASAEPQTARYVGVNPWDQGRPDCESAPGGHSLGLGGACFRDVPADAVGVRVTLVDDLLGPGYGGLAQCIDHGVALTCYVTPICGGVAETRLRGGADFITVTTYTPVEAATFCGGLLHADAWLPTQGTITLAYVTDA